MAWILATFLYIVWSSEFCRCEEVLSTEQSIAQAQQSNNEMEHSENQVNNSNHHKWSNGVYYIFEPGASEKLKKCFHKAKYLWEKMTCVNFTQGQGDDGYGYLNVTDKYDYKSDIGRLGNEQIFSIGKKCDEEIGRAIRELGQVLGLYLTKDSHVAVMPEGMNKSALDELEGISQKGSDLSGKNHDYGSIIRSGSPAEKQNLADWNYRKTIGSHMISFMDLWLVNEYYGCHDICKKEKKKVVCENGGFPHPRKCNERCICPIGYGGKRCKLRNQKCGGDFNATDQWQPLKISVRNEHELRRYHRCQYWIRSPNDTVIEIKIALIRNEFAQQGCPEAAVEIKTNDDHTLTGYRFCSQDDERTKLKSRSNFVPIVAYNSYYFFPFMAQLEYRYVKAT